jgi:N-formylglutamate deformylase
MSIGGDTLSGLNLFADEIKGRYIMHIPHAHIDIPEMTGYISNDVVDQEILKLTDWATDLIFNVDGVDRIVTPFSRVFCDVERFSNDNEEPMSKMGRGFYYTKTDDGQRLRTENKEHKERVYDLYYRKHHEQFLLLVESKLNIYGMVVVIDCHSFAETPFESDTDKSENRPDICIGSDLEQTSYETLVMFKNYFVNLGYKVKINSPYSGTIFPLKYYKDSRVDSIMIELNRKLYMDDEHTINLKNIIRLQREIKKIFEF